jgi:polar amino acid transport system substrate-binding protein
MRKFGLLLILVLLGMVLLTGTAMAEDALDKALKKGKLVVSTEVGTPPWAFKDPKTGEVDGFPVELARMFAKELGVELEIKNFEWTGVIPSLLTKKVDMLVAPLSRTIPRTAKLMYVEPYVNMPAQILAVKGKFKSLEDLNMEGVVITASAGSVWEEVVEKRFPKATVAAAATNVDNGVALNTGRAVAYLNDRLQLEATIGHYPDKFEILPEAVSWDSLAFAVRFDSPKLRESANLFMRLVKMDGRYAKLFKKYMGYEWKPTPETDS